MMQGILAVCALVCVAPVVLGQQATREVWKFQEYPDPFSYDSYRICGRYNKSSVCDPNRVISEEKANDIDSLISGVYRETRCGCPKCISNAHGFVIRVAIMDQMESIIKANTTEDRLRDAQIFSYMLSKQWAMDKSCNESLVILFSKKDAVLYTLTLPLARTMLGDEDVKRITMSVRPLFDNDATIGEGLKEMIRRYKMVFEGRKAEAIRPMTAKRRSNGASDVSPSFFLSLLLTAFLITVAH